MAGKQYLELSTTTGAPKRVEGLQSSAGAGDAGKIIALDAVGLISATMMPVGIVPGTQSIQCTENLAAGDWINVYDSSGARCRKADASTTGKTAKGFVLSAFTSGQTALVYHEGTNTQITGRTPGKTQWLSVTVPGGSQETCPTVDGQTSQIVGTATQATAIPFEPQVGFEL